MDDYGKYYLLEKFRDQLKENTMTIGLAEQIDLLVGRYGDEYLELAEKVLSAIEMMGYDTLFICQQYIYDYLLQLRKFLKTGDYGHNDYGKIKEDIYHNAQIMMQTYMPGLFMAYSNTTILYTKYHLFKNKFLPLLNPERMRQGVEVGFGEGFYLWELSNNIPDIKFVGFDISEHAITFASALFENSNILKSRYTLQLGDITKGLPAEDSSYDFGILAEVIEHIENPEKGVSEIARLLIPNGYLYLTTVIDSNHMDHITNFESPQVVEAMLTNQGFMIIDKSIYRIQDDFSESKDISVGLAFVCKKVSK